MKSHEELLDENKALSAQVVILKAAYGNLAGAVNNLDEADTDSEEIIDEMWGQVFSVMQDGWNSFSREPQQCLADIKAEAGRAGFVAGANWLYVSQLEFDVVEDQKVDAADKYSARIRSTGTWLKDSNVNGGKRHGGEK